MKRTFLLIIAIVALSISGSHAQFPSIPILGGGVSKDKNCDQPKYYKMGVLCQDTNDGRLYKGDGNQIIEIAAGTSEGDMLGAEYAVGKKIKPSAGGTGLDTSSMTGFPTVSSGTWSILSVASVKAALGFLTSSDFPVTGVETPTPGMIPKWGSSGNTLVDGFAASDFQATLTNPVTGAATTTQGMIPVWGATSNTLADGYAATYFQTALTNPVTGVASPTPGYLTKWGESGNSIADGLKLGTLTDGRWCTYTTADGLKCTETKPAGEGGGISLSDIYTGVITDGALPKYNSATDTLSEGLKLGTLTNDKWCKYTTAGGLICNSDEPSGGGIAVSDIYLETITDGNLTSYDETSGKLKDAGPAIAYTQPDTNLPLCRTGDGAVGACTYLTDTVAGGFDVTASYAPTGTWNWSGVNAATTWPTFNQDTTGNAATATTATNATNATNATTATNLSSYAVLYDGAMTDGHIVKYDDTSKKLKDAGAAVGYTEPQSNLPLCRTGSGAVGACTNLTDVVVPQGGGGGYTNLTSFVAQTPWRLFYSNTGGAVTELALGADGQYLKSNGASSAPTWDTPSGSGSDIDYDPPQTPTPLCSDASGAIIACTNLKDEDLASIEGSADDIGVKVETVSTDPKAVIECEGKDRNYIVGFNEPSFFQLPADPSGIRYCFGNNDYGAAISIVPDGTDTITHGGTATDEGEGLVSSGSEEDWICLLGLSSSKWRTISSLGTWTIDDVELPSEPEEPPPGDIVYTDCSNIGTAAFYWNGDHTSGATYACTSSSTTIVSDLLEGSHVNSTTDPGYESPESGGTVYKTITPSQRFRFSVTSADIFDSAEGMWCADVYFTGHTSNNDLVNILAPTYGEGQLQCRVNSSGQLLFYHTSSDSGNVYIGLTSTATIPVETWTRVCVRWSATNGDYGQGGIKIGANNWETAMGTDARPCRAWVSEPTVLSPAGSGQVADTFYVDNISIYKSSGL